MYLKPVSVICKKQSRLFCNLIIKSTYIKRKNLSKAEILQYLFQSLHIFNYEDILMYKICTTSLFTTTVQNTDLKFIVCDISVCDCCVTSLAVPRDLMLRTHSHCAIYQSSQNQSASCVSSSRCVGGPQRVLESKCVVHVISLDMYSLWNPFPWHVVDDAKYLFYNKLLFQVYLCFSYIPPTLHKI